MLTISQSGLSFLKDQERLAPTPGRHADDDTLLSEELKMPIKEVRHTIQFIDLYAFFGSLMPDPRKPLEHPDYRWLKDRAVIQRRFDALVSIRFSMTYDAFRSSDFILSLFAGASDDRLRHHLNRLVYTDDPDHPGQRLRSPLLVSRRTSESTRFFE